MHRWYQPIWIQRSKKRHPSLKKWELFVLQADTDSVNEFSQCYTVYHLFVRYYSLIPLANAWNDENNKLYIYCFPIYF